MEVVDPEGDWGLAWVLAAGIANGAGGWAEKPRTVISPPVVIAGRAERDRPDQDDQCGRDEYAVLRPEELGLENGRDVWPDLERPFIEKDTDRKPAKEHEHAEARQRRLYPPGIPPKRGEEPEPVWRSDSGLSAAHGGLVALSAFSSSPPQFYQRCLWIDNRVRTSAGKHIARSFRRKQ